MGFSPFLKRRLNSFCNSFLSASSADLVFSAFALAAAPYACGGLFDEFWLLSFPLKFISYYLL